MKAGLRGAAFALLLGLLALGPVAAGKLWVWQGLLVALVAAVALALWSVAGLLPEPPRPVQPQPKKRKAAAAPEAQTPLAESWRPDALDWALVAFLAWQCLSWLVSVYPFATSLYLAKVCSYAIVFWICRYGLWPRGAGGTPAPRGWQAALWGLVGGGGLLAVMGLREYVRTVHFLGDTGWRVFGPMVNPNAAAGYLLLTIFPALALLLGSRSRAGSVPSGPAAPDLRGQTPRYPEIGAGFAFVLMFATLLLTGSKAGLGALLVGIGLFAVVGLSGRRKAQTVVIGLALLTVALALLAPPIRLRLLSAFGSQSHSTIFRLYTWEAALHMIQARPWLGFGGGTFEHILPRFAIAGFTREAHQSFLQIAGETGLPGLALGLMWGGWVLRRLLAAARAGEPLVKYVAAGALAALVASALQELFDYPWYVPAVGYGFFALAGMALAPGLGGGFVIRGRGFPAPTVTGPGAWSGLESPSHSAGAEVPRLRPSLGLTPRAWRHGGLILALLLMGWSGKNLIAEGIGAQGEAEASVRAYASASATYARAARWNPAQARFAVQQSKTEEALAAGGDENALAKAVQARQRAIALQPTEPLNYLALARLYETAGRMPDALAAAQAALQHYPNYPRGLAELGQLQEKAGQHEASLQTYRQLLALRDSPVGLYPAVEGPGETAFAWGWLALGDEAWNTGQEQEALAAYSQAVKVLRPVIEWGQSTQEMAGAGGVPLGNLPENVVLAEEVLQRLRRSTNPLALMRQAELLLAMRRGDEAKERLRALRGGAGDLSAMTRVWGALTLAKQLHSEKQGQWRALAEEGLGAYPSAIPDAAALERRGWFAEDTADLDSLRSWAKQALTASPTGG